MRFAFKTSLQDTTWADMLAVWKLADDIELFESGWTFDHFYPIFADSSGPCLEGWITLTALAQATSRLRMGTLVTGIRIVTRRFWPTWRPPSTSFPGAVWSSGSELGGTRRSREPMGSSWAHRPNGAIVSKRLVR